MASASTPASMSGAARPNRAMGICQIIGLVCVFGFTLNMLVLFLPPQLGSSAWRLGFIQQFSDRSIVLLLGMGLLLAGCLENRRWLRQLSLLSLFMGGIYLITCVLVVSDTLSLRQLALTNISAQENQIQTEIRNAQSNPDALGEEITVEQLRQASQMLAGQADIAKQNAQTGLLKTGIANLINLLVVGLGLVGLGRFGLNSRKR